MTKRPKALGGPRKAEEPVEPQHPMGNLLRLLWRLFLLALALPVRWPRRPKLPARTYLVVRSPASLTKYAVRTPRNPFREYVVHDAYSCLGVVPRARDTVCVVDYPLRLDPVVLGWLRSHATRKGARVIYRHSAWAPIVTGFRQEIRGEFVDE